MAALKESSSEEEEEEAPHVESPSWYAVDPTVHDAVVSAAFRKRGFDAEEAAAAASCCRSAAYNGSRTHHAIKGLDVDAALGSAAGGCVPATRWRVLESRFKGVERWDARKCSGFLVADAAMARACELAEEYGTGCVAVDNAFHYLFGAKYVMDAARAGYVGFTTCTGAIPEVVPYGGTRKAMGTNPWTYALPTRKALGYDVVVDWATSVVSNGAVKAMVREGRRAPEGAIYDAAGNPTTDPTKFAGHACFGGHKGYSLCVLTELLAAFNGGSLPSIRSGASDDPSEKTTCNFLFQAWHPDALAPASLAAGRATVDDNVRAVAADVLGDGNGGARLPGDGKRRARARCDAAGGLLFTASEVEALDAIAAGVGVPFEVAARFTEADLAEVL